MSTNNAEFEMCKCFKCYYYYPKENLAKHLQDCKSVESRIECPICFCDYPRTIINNHTVKCNGIEDTIQFISEYSRNIYPRNIVKKLFGVLKVAYGKEIHGRDILRVINEDSFKIDQWVSMDNDDYVRKMECPICILDVPLDDIFVLSCADNHKVCYNCLLQHSLLKLKQNSPVNCPHEKCNQIIHINEIKCLPFPAHLVDKLTEKYERQLFDTYVQNEKGAIRCPNTTCDWVAFYDVYERLNVRCDKCKQKFCSICNGACHYRVECKEIPIITQKWMVWCNVGRRGRQVEKDRLNQQIANYQQAKAANEVRNKELTKNFENLKQDETWKVQNCRLCPKCNRVVQK